MYTTLLCFLIAVTIHVLAPRDRLASWSAGEIGVMLLTLGASWLFVRSRMRRLALKALSEERSATLLRPRFTRIVQDDQTLLLLPFAAFTYLTDYNSLVVLPFMERSQAIGGFLGLLPYFAMWGMLWWEAYPLKSVLFGPGDTRWSFFTAHARMETAVVTPWFALLALGDLFALVWPQGSKFLDSNPMAQLLYAPLFLGIAAIFMPLLVKKLWGCTPVPPGPLRDRLEADVKRLGLKVREILFWPLLGGRLITAGIVGPAPRFRYLLITPALASLLDAEEMAAVIAHETGHVRHKHLWFYLFYFSGLLIGGLAIFFKLSYAAVVWWAAAFPDASESRWAGSAISVFFTITMGAVIFIGFRMLFGYLSRAFERQADLYALEAFGRPGPVISALDAISSHSGDIRDLPSWHHGSVRERINFIALAAEDPNLASAHHLQVQKIRRVITALMLVLFAGAAALHFPAVDRGLLLRSYESGAMNRVATHPEDWKTWGALGDMRLGEGREKDALTAYLGAVKANPADYNALNNAAWVMATASDPGVRDPASAVELASRAARIMPAPHILDTLAEALWKTGDLAGAAKAIETALDVAGPMDPNRREYEEKLLKIKKSADQTAR